ncbi:U-box domain-containing protein 33 [Capsicum annuum]|uniref:RING-type E3 ubiquitin transferase n=1 Tax=Capsicum annuum TaxID=4072 RepID=A0A1U8E2T5_CAPAN|nr:U-box domain-containing protein 33 [Capsicum annuum]KAF3646343.1 U-box domain-containing protein 33 [Capsicum annuum]PHT74531.1 U-box domain-containing protein 33 [Capsicum annuum]
MAMETPSPRVRRSPVRYPEVDLSLLNLTEQIVQEGSSPLTPVRVVDDVMYVAVGKDLKETEPTLTWALHKSGGRKICILHVHTPAQKIPMMGTKFNIDQLDVHQVRTYHEKERQEMHKILEKYVLICGRAGVRADKLVLEMDSIENGIVELISQHGIGKLVMGAAANKCYSKKMTDLRSKKAIYVRLQAPAFCCIWFVCKGNLIYTRESKSERLFAESVSSSIPASPVNDIVLRSSSVTEGYNEQVQLRGPCTDYHRVASDNQRIIFSGFSSGGTLQANFPSMSSDRSADSWDGIPPISPSVASRLSLSSSVEMANDSLARTEGNETAFDSSALHYFNFGPRQSSPPSIAERVNDELAGSMNDELYDKFEQYVAEAETARREAFEESIKRRKAEKDAIEARRRAKASETVYADELRRRRELEEALAKDKEKADQMKSQLNKLREDLQAAQAQTSSLEGQLLNSDTQVQELEQKIFSAVDLLQKYRKERDELQVERDDALKLAEALREKNSDGSSFKSTSVLFAEFYFHEIEEATRNFDPALKIGEGGYGSIYRGLLRHTQVAIKMLHPHSLQGPSEFQQEVNILSKLRHPNIVTLIGACPEAWTLVYEYLPNGSLEDRLTCKDNTPPLSWQTRIRVATELCCALIFLHSCTARGIIHGDLKPANILLDANFVSKLSDFGICRVLSEDDFSENSTTLCYRTDPKGTFAYMDPEFLETGELTPKSDVYSFGIILLRLLTGRPALGIKNEIQYALDKGTLKNLLDPTAGDWPFVQAKQLAHLAMSCCEKNRRCRPDLPSEVWKVLEPMRASCGASSLKMGSDEPCDIPSYFICPIFQEVMQDPVVAADGFTYEAEALRGWLDSGHETSPMTNLTLSHKNLVPNHALRSAIQEWLQQS